ncbi:NUDIX domain-containing protein [Candidatus Woesearchaeota archaeon]|nr:NUDIX domain-containing protein [Candidatus Woesearchaeota archaeon]
MKKETSAGAVLVLNEPPLLNEVKQGAARAEPKYLLLHYTAGHWDFPKGHVEHGESNEKTARREIEEETGIKELKILPEFKETIHYFFKQNKQLYSRTKINEQELSFRNLTNFHLKSDKEIRDGARELPTQASNGSYRHKQKTPSDAQKSASFAIYAQTSGVHKLLDPPPQVVKRIPL